MPAPPGQLLCPSAPCRFPASPDPAIFAAQKTMVEAWTIVGEAFVDGSFNHHDWERELSKVSWRGHTSDQLMAPALHVMLTD